MNEREQVEVNDLYEGAYLLCCGYPLVDLQWDRDGHACFVISGKGLRSHVDAFRSGSATGNICMYLFALERLKDRLFSERRKQGR